MVSDVIVSTEKNLKLCKIKNLDDIYNTNNKLVTFSKKMQLFDKKIKSFLKQKCIFIKMLIQN